MQIGTASTDRYETARVTKAPIFGQPETPVNETFQAASPGQLNKSHISTYGQGFTGGYTLESTHNARIT